MQKNEILRSYGKNYKEMTKHLLTEAGLIDDIRSKGRRGSIFRIGIKPNLVSPVPAEFGGTTHPEIVAGIIEYLLENRITADEIEILEGSWVGDKTSEAFEYCGYRSLSEKYGVKFYDLQKDAFEPVDCAGMKINICRKALELDYLINVPVLKGHCQTKMTCALKNMKGVIPNSEKRHFHQIGLHRPIAHLNTGIHQDFIVTDHICGDPDFEEGGSPLVRDCIMVSSDPVLTDAYACSVLGYTADDVQYVGLAEQLGVGNADLSELVLRTVEGECTEGEPSECGAAINGSLARKILDLSVAVDEIDSCSACVGVLIPVLERLKEEGLLDGLMKKLGEDRLGIGQGHRGKKGKAGVGNCTSGFDFCIHGCPPKAEDIYSGLKSFMISK